LSRGLRSDVRTGTGQYALQLRPSSVVPLTPADDYAGFISDHSLRAEARCAVLCSDAVAEEVARFLQALSDTPSRPRRDDTLPEGWCLFTDVRPSMAIPPPPGLDRLRVETTLALVPKGGLRLGRRWTWLEGVPARLSLVGSYGGLCARIDGV